LKADPVNANAKRYLRKTTAFVVCVLAPLKPWHSLFRPKASSGASLYVCQSDSECCPECRQMPSQLWDQHSQTQKKSFQLSIPWNLEIPWNFPWKLKKD
jgi:hypothetical protein